MSKKVLSYLNFTILLGLLVFAVGCINDNSAENTRKTSSAKEIRFKEFLTRLDQYMLHESYDSAQILLNNYSENSSSQINLFTYIISSRQAEIYYYNNLHHLGLQESQRAVELAQELNNKSLLLDAYNFCGLFHTNLDSFENALDCFRRGIKASHQQDFTLNKEYDLSKPYHIYGNLAEAFYGINQIDSCIYYSKTAQILAYSNGDERAVTAAIIQLGAAFLKTNHLDSAIYYFENAREKSRQQGIVDLELLILGNLAISEYRSGSKKLAHQYLQDGFEMSNSKQLINSYYHEQFLEKALEIYAAENDFFHLSNTTEALVAVNKKVQNAANVKYLDVVMAEMSNNSKILNMEIEKAIQARKLANTRLMIFGLILLISIIGFFTYRFFAKRKLDLAILRNNISQDLHDEVGATLSGIALYSHVIKNQLAKGKMESVGDSLVVIEKNATDMVKKLSDIIWAVNPKYDDFEHLLSRLHEFAIELAHIKSIKVTLEDYTHSESIKLKMEQRKNLFLICKEALNNAVKYSDCEHIWINASIENKHLEVKISDDGKGFDLQKANKGNGLENIQSRTTEMDGILGIQTSSAGTVISINIKIT